MIRKYCETGKIPEATRTAHGHWQIRRRLSGKTLLFLAKLRGEWPFDGSGETNGDLEPEWAEILMKKYFRSEKLDKMDQEELDEHGFPSGLSPELVKAFVQIEKEVSTRETKGEPVWDLQLHGYVKQYWLMHQCRPTVAEIIEMMRISRREFYRRGLSSNDLKDAYDLARGAFPSEMIGPNGLDSVDETNRKAKKPGFTHLHRDLYGDSD